MSWMQNVDSVDGETTARRRRRVAENAVMHHGISIVAGEMGMRPDDLARLAEQRGHGYLFFADHTHVPASRATPFPGGEPLPGKYWRTYDQFTALTAAALATTSLRVGTGVCLIAQRDPIVTAKQIATIDHLSGGRVEFGVGAGWNLEEMANHRYDPSTRFSRMAEHVAAMKAIWTQEEASYDGRHVSFQRVCSWPKPAQRPHPPVLVGGVAPKVLDRVLAFGDGWMPLAIPGIEDRVPELRRRAAEQGRSVTVCVSGAPPDPAVLERYAAVGVDRVLFEVPVAGRGPVERALDAAETALAEAFGT
jgi:probable F420-dependent oxidoreductase